MDKDKTQVKPAQEPNPDWSEVTAEQGLRMLLAMRDGRPEEELTDALRAMPQRGDRDTPA